MIDYPIVESLEQSIVNLAIEHESELPEKNYEHFNETTVPVAWVILTNGKRAQVQLVITENWMHHHEDDEDLPVMDLSAGKELVP